ncbi:MAG: MOSC domain-containing protein [Caulobacterales bacterium 32-69-10]|nr:MAG: MOSC domain-containing protein [Caulobacterales bacterium 32-69-10]
MPGRIDAIYRHPIKGFTPERLDTALLEAGAYFPCDRLYAVENGPSGFDPAAPRPISKMKFTVLATIPALARARTTYDEATGVLTVQAEGQPPFMGRLADEAGRTGFADWLSRFVDEEDRRGPLKVLETVGAHRFMDDVRGAVSVINLASVRDLGERLGRAIDPLRFRANLYVEGWAPWAEMGFGAGAELTLGETTCQVVKPIVRCAATHVDPATGERDIDLVPALYANYGHRHCGLYLNVAWGGQVAVGDAAAVVEAPVMPMIGDKSEIRI